MPPERALEFGLALSAFSFVLLDSLVNLPTALLALAGNLFYVLVYTRWLKRSTPQNIVIGGAAGAVPPLVGYAGAAGHLGWAALVMFAIVFVWTPPHFWALALMIKEHYASAGRADAARSSRGDRETARQIVLYTVVLVAVTLAPVAFGVFGLVYGVAALVLGAVFAWCALELRRDARARRAPCSSSTTRCSTSRCSSSRWRSTRWSDDRDADRAARRDAPAEREIAAQEHASGAGRSSALFLRCCFGGTFLASRCVYLWLDS